MRVSHSYDVHIIFYHFRTCSLFPVPCSLLPAPCSLLPVPCSLFPKTPIIVPHLIEKSYICHAGNSNNTDSSRNSTV
ncbi:MAG: hypothetical protein F6K55_06380 [Moorea sp. SIO4A3]|nr:hypothetical protein [Moorena sp. SIO4A3]